MDDKAKSVSATSQGSGLPKRLFHWMDQRTGVDELMKESLDEPIPGGARFAYVFGSGLLFILLSQIITGICLALYYVPSAEAAHTSVAYITKVVAAGAFLRSLHYYGSSAMIIVLMLHFLQTFLFGSYKGRRELLWISGATLSFLVLGMGFTGYLLPWDQKAYFATAVGTNIMGQVPVIGNWLTRALRGGTTIGTLTLSRFYVAHVFLLPAGIFAFIFAHVFLFRKAGAAGPVHEHPIEPKLATEKFYPRQVFMDMAFAFALMAGLSALAYFHPIGLGPIANPADTHFLPRPEWYALPLFEWLKFWEGPKVVFAVVVVPGLLAGLFFLLPFIDRSLERRPWRRPIPVLSVAIVILGLVFLGVKGRLDDQRDPVTTAQLDLQAQQEKDYTAAPFRPFIESPGGSGPLALPVGQGDPLVAHGAGIFHSRGCSGCHGQVGLGGAMAPSLEDVTAKFPRPQLITLLHNPTARMRAGGMPVVDISPSDMSALVAYLGVIGTSAANVQGPSPIPSSGRPGSGLSLIAMDGSRPAGLVRGVDAAQQSAVAAAGQQLFQEHACFACHGASGEGGLAPALASLVAPLTDAQLEKLLEHPSPKMRQGGMPPVLGTADQRSSLIAYLRTLKPAQPQTPQPRAQERAQAQQPIADEASRQDSGVLYAQITAPRMAEGQAATVPTDTRSAASSRAPASSPALLISGDATNSSPGRALFLSRGCVACHGTAAEGTHFAPSLIGVGKKFGSDKLPELLRNPTPKMRAGGMPTSQLSITEIQQLVVYLLSLEPAPPAVPRVQTTPELRAANFQTTAPSVVAAREAPTTKLEPSPTAVPISYSSDLLAQRGQRVFQQYSCETCHGVGGVHGTVAAPPLAGTASMLPPDVLENLLRHYTVRMKQGGMPPSNISSQDMKALVSFIRSLPNNTDHGM